MAVTLGNIYIKDSADWNTYLDLVYPIGALYISATSTSPASLLGGTWSSVTGGKYLRANASFDNGGSNTISIDQMPSHNHGWKQWNFIQHKVYGYSGGTAYGYISSGSEKTNYTDSTGGATLLSNISKRLCLEKNSLAFVEVC
jgi:hypothetical protein